MTRTAITAHGNRPVSRRGDSLKHLRHREHPFGVSACAVLSHGPALREPPQHGKRAVRNEFLERRVAGRHSFFLHNGRSYFGRRERPRCCSKGVLRKPGQLIVGKVSCPTVGPLWRDGIGVCCPAKIT
jgi:hypothetical protein